MCDCLLIVLLGTLFPYQLGPVAQSPGTERKNASYALGKRDKRNGAQKNPSANQQKMIKLHILLKTQEPSDLKSMAHPLLERLPTP